MIRLWYNLHVPRISTSIYLWTLQLHSTGPVACTYIATLKRSNLKPVSQAYGLALLINEKV